MSLQDDLFCFYKFEEDSTASLSSVGDSGLDQIWSYSSFVPCDAELGPTTGWDTPQRTAGVIGYALDLNLGWTQARQASNFHPGRIDFNMAGKVKIVLGLPGGTEILWCMRNDYTQNPIYALRSRFAAGKPYLEWEVYGATNGIAPYTAVTVSSDPLEYDTWYTVSCGIDFGEEEIFLQVDCGAVNTSAFAFDSVPEYADPSDYCFHFGRDGASYPYSACHLDAIGGWNRRLTEEENGLICEGAEYPFGDDQQAWLVYLCGIDNAEDVAAAQYGVPTTFLFPNPVAGTAYYRDEVCIDLNQTGAGRMWLVKLRRQGGNSLDTSTAGGIFVALEFSYDALAPGAISNPGRSVTPITAGYGQQGGLYRGNPVAAVIGRV